MFTPCMFLCGLEVINMCVYARTNIVSQWAPIFSNSNWCLLFLGGGWGHGFKTHWVKLYIYIKEKKWAFQKCRSYSLFGMLSFHFCLLGSIFNDS